MCGVALGIVSYRAHRSLCGGPCNLQVVAAGAGIHIQHFARKIQAGAQLALHGFGVNLFGIHAASRNHRVLQIAQFADGHLPVLAQVYQCHLVRG